MGTDFTGDRGRRAGKNESDFFEGKTLIEERLNTSAFLIGKTNIIMFRKIIDVNLL